MSDSACPVVDAEKEVCIQLDICFILRSVAVLPLKPKFLSRPRAPHLPLAHRPASTTVVTFAYSLLLRHPL